LTDEQNKGPSAIYRRVFMVVAALSVLSLVFAAFIYHSETFASKTVDWYINRHAGDPGIKVELEGFSGSLAAGFKFARLTVRRLKPPLQIQIYDADAQADFSEILTGGKIRLAASLSRVDLVGMSTCPIASSSVPDYHAFACFAGLPANVEIASFTVGHTAIKPFHDFPFQVEIASFTLHSADASGSSPLRADFTAQLRDKPVGRGVFSGSLQQRQRKLDGSLDLQIFGQTISTELALVERRGCPEISGYISSTTLDISKISHWLIPLWQDAFPFGFDGSIDCTGSWLFNSEVGFLGNLSGRCHNLRMVAQGLFITLFELTGSWKIFDGSFSFNDEGSRFFGFPAALTGKVESVLQSSRRWELDFNCLTIDFARLTENLPWGVKYSMALPPLSGGATFSLQLRGSRPEISARLNTDDLSAGKKPERRNVTGAITYYLGAEGPGNLGIDMQCRSEYSLPPIFSRFKNGGGRLNNTLSGWQGPFLWQYNLQGSDSANLSFVGSLKAGDRSLETNGRWHDGMGTIHTILDQNVFVAGNIPVLDLILAK